MQKTAAGRVCYCARYVSDTVSSRIFELKNIFLIFKVQIKHFTFIIPAQTVHVLFRTFNRFYQRLILRSIFCLFFSRELQIVIVFLARFRSFENRKCVGLVWGTTIAPVLPITSFWFRTSATFKFIRRELINIFAVCNF